MIHCRSYIAADIGLSLKKRFGVKFFFDMRGFWADEKKDGGSWKMDHPVFKRVYRYYKNKEKQYIQNADYIISLTEAGKREMLTWDSLNKNIPLQVIPCCADMEHFSLNDQQQKKTGKEKLGIAESELLVSYLGSIGTWYMLDEMLVFFKVLKKTYPNAKFLFVTHTHPSNVKNKIGAFGLDANDFIITEATRQEVPALIKASDFNLSFIRPVYSKLSSSPTKLGEVLSMGIPVIVNSGVGDVKKIVEQAGAGVVLDGFTETDFSKAVAVIPDLLQRSPLAIREAIKDIYSLDKGIQAYLSCYREIL